jgi:hypothetical protein
VAAEVKQVEYWRWWLTDDTGRRKATTWRMRREEALKHDPNAEPVEGSRELRSVPESSDEWNVARKPD